MDIKELEALLGEMKDEWFPDHAETNVFSIGGRGYYENPTSAMLAFFCNSEKEHELGNLVSNALFKALPNHIKVEKIKNYIRSGDYEALKVISTEREVSTKEGRIDLLLISDNWVMAIENKIYHHIQDNPLGSYEEYVNNNYSDKEHFFVVLSPDGKSKGNWIPLRYSDFTKQVRSNINLDIETISLNQPVNKWLILLREFILNLEEITMTSNISKDAMKLVFENTHKLKEIEVLRAQANEKFRKELCISITEKLRKELGKDFPTVQQGSYTWKGKDDYGFSNLEFWLYSWSITLRAVLFPDGKEDGRDNRSFSIWYGVCDANTEEKLKLVKDHLEPDSYNSKDVANAGQNHWYEDKRRFGFDQKDEILNVLVEKIKLLDEFHNKVKDRWQKA